MMGMCCGQDVFILIDLFVVGGIHRGQIVVLILDGLCRIARVFRYKGRHCCVVTGGVISKALEISNNRILEFCSKPSSSTSYSAVPV